MRAPGSTHTQMLTVDPVVAMAAAANEGDTHPAGDRRVDPVGSHCAVTANAFASLNKLAPGTIDFGIGTGFTGRRAMGLGAVKLADMEEYIRIVMGCCTAPPLRPRSIARSG